MKKINKRYVLLSAFFTLCIVGIIVTTMLIEKTIQGYLAEIGSDVNINIEVVNNTNDEVDVVESEDKITIYVEPEESTEDIQEVTVISESGLNIRQEPGVDSDVVGTLYYGAEIEVIGVEGDWYETDLGFIYSEYVN